MLKYKITPTDESTGLFSIYTNGNDIVLCDPQGAITCRWGTCAAVVIIRIRLFIWDMKSMEACKQGIKIHMHYNSKFTLKMNTRNIVIQGVGSIQLFKATCLLCYGKRI